jgi:hypothetical protein
VASLGADSSVHRAANMDSKQWPSHGKNQLLQLLTRLLSQASKQKTTILDSLDSAHGRPTLLEKAMVKPDSQSVLLLRT